MFGCTWNYKIGDEVAIADDIGDSDDYEFLKNLKGKKLLVYKRLPSDDENVEHYFLKHDGLVVEGKRGNPFPFIDADLKKFKYIDNTIEKELKNISIAIRVVIVVGLILLFVIPVYENNMSFDEVVNNWKELFAPSAAIAIAVVIGMALKR